MKIFDIDVPRNFNLWCLADFHVGTVAFADRPFQRMIQDVKKDPLARVVGLGDYVEGRSVDHPYFEMDNLDLNTPIAYKQAEEVIRLLEPIKNKILVLGEGNHDRYSRGYIGMVENIICKELQVPFGTWSYIINFKSKSNSFKGFFTHGSDRRSPVRSTSPIGIRKIINEKLSLISILSAPAMADCVINTCGHYHRIITYNPKESKELYLYVKDDYLKQSYKTPEHDGDYIPVFERYYACTGAWLRQYVNGISTYGERAGFSPVSLGVVVYKVRGGKVVYVENIGY